MRNCTIKIMDEVNVVILNLSVEHYEYFYEKYGMFTKTYHFDPKYKLGIWDGKIRFFSRTGETSIHFLSEIVPELKKLNYNISIKDNRSPVVIDIPKIDNTFLQSYGITLGDHQVNAINLSTENNSGIVLAGTGAGKSIITACLLKLYEKYCNFRCLVIVPTTDLVLQTSGDIAKFDVDVGYLYDKKDLDHKHLVSTWQSLGNMRQIMGDYNCIIVDECHGVKGHVLKKMMLENGSKAVVRLGLTGTLPEHKTDRTTIISVLGNVLCEIPAYKLIESGWLAELSIKCLTLKEDFSEQYEKFKIAYPEDAKKVSYLKFKNSYFPDYASEKAYIQKNVFRSEFIAELLRATVQNEGNTFCLVPNIKYGKFIAEKAGGIFVEADDGNEIRKAIYNQFAVKNDVLVMATYRLASVGLNIPRIFNFFLIDPNKSYIEIIQSIGRSIRKAEDKNSVNVWDISSDLNYSSSHRRIRQKYYKENKYPFTNSSFDYNKILEQNKIDKNNESVIY